MPRAPSGVSILMKYDRNLSEGSRKMSNLDFALFRGYIEGIDKGTLVDSYLPIDEPSDFDNRIKTIRLNLRTIAVRELKISGRRADLLLNRYVEPAAEVETRDEQVGITGLERRPPTIEEYIEERGLNDFSVEEILAHYEEDYPQAKKVVKKAEERHHIKMRQIRLLRQLEDKFLEQPKPSDHLDIWFPPGLVFVFAEAGIRTIYQLNESVSRGGRWWLAIKGIGRVKAKRIESWIDRLLPSSHKKTNAPTATSRELFLIMAGAATLERSSREGEVVIHSPTPSSAHTPLLGSQRDYTALPYPCDPDAIEAWIRAKAGSQVTAKTYRKEAMRFLVWALNISKRTLHGVDADACLSYMAFLTHIPEEWINRKVERVYQPDGEWMREGAWRPFRKQISPASRQQALIILSSMYDWLVKAGYLERNPWHFVNRKIKDSKDDDLFESRAFSKDAWAAFMAHIEQSEPSPALSRLKFILLFCEATGLRAAELLGATTDKIRVHNSVHLVMQVQGKGSKNRIIALPHQAARALEEYLANRNVTLTEAMKTPLPLLPSSADETKPISYPTLYKLLKRFFVEVSNSNGIPTLLKEEMAKGSTHWLRHTFGTRALERGAELDAIQRQLGHSDPRTTMRYSKAQLDRLSESMDKAFG